MPDDVLTDDEVLEMVRKGCSRFMRGYPWLARDIFQAGAEAACLARSRGHSGGAMMLYITGAAKDLLSEFAPREVNICEFNEDYFSPITEYKVTQVMEFIDDLVSDPVDRSILIMIGAGYKYEEIAEKLNYSVSGIKRRLLRIRKSVGGKSNYTKQED